MPGSVHDAWDQARREGIDEHNHAKQRCVELLNTTAALLFLGDDIPKSGAVFSTKKFGAVVAVRRRKGQILAMIRGWGGRWYAVDSVLIEHAGRALLS